MWQSGSSLLNYVIYTESRAGNRKKYNSSAGQAMKRPTKTLIEVRCYSDWLLKGKPTNIIETHFSQTDNRNLIGLIKRSTSLVKYGWHNLCLLHLLRLVVKIEVVKGLHQHPWCFLSNISMIMSTYVYWIKIYYFIYIRLHAFSPLILLFNLWWHLEWAVF